MGSVFSQAFAGRENYTGGHCWQLVLFSVGGITGCVKQLLWSWGDHISAWLCSSGSQLWGMVHGGKVQVTEKFISLGPNWSFMSHYQEFSEGLKELTSTWKLVKAKGMKEFTFFCSSQRGWGRVGGGERGDSQ